MRLTDIKWETRFMRLAHEVASWSKDPRHKVGAVLVSPDGRQQSVGYNGLPAGVDDTETLLNDRDLKNKLTVHAELNAILNSPVRPDGWTLFSTRHPCGPCAVAIAQAGVSRVVCPSPEDEGGWCASQADAIVAFDLAGVKVTCIEEE